MLAKHEMYVGTLEMETLTEHRLARPWLDSDEVSRMVYGLGIEKAVTLSGSIFTEGDTGHSDLNVPDPGRIQQILPSLLGIFSIQCFWY
jgi:hypothetical protein